MEPHPSRVAMDGAALVFVEAERNMRTATCHIAAASCLVVLMSTCIGSYEAFAGQIVAACPSPMAPRRALPDDTVCVQPDSRARVAAENARAPLLWIPGPFGPKTCAQGYVWREATPLDLVCVTTAVRSLVAAEQANPKLAPGQ